jgi:hypothetical protein
MLETGRWKVQVKPFSHLITRGRVSRCRSNCLCYHCFFATTLFFYFDNTRSDMDSVIFGITEKCCSFHALSLTCQNQGTRCTRESTTSSDHFSPMQWQIFRTY